MALDKGAVQTGGLDKGAVQSAADTGLTVAVGFATETDTAQALTSAKVKAIGLAAEIDTAQTVTADRAHDIGIATETDTAFAATATLKQFARPFQDITAGGWVPSSGVDLWPMLDEVVADDADFIQSSEAPVNDACEVQLEGLGDPLSSIDHTVRYRYAKTEVSAQMDLTVALMEGATERASWGHTDISTTLTTAAQTLTGPQADSIANYSDLRLRFTANQPDPAPDYEVQIEDWDATTSLTGNSFGTLFQNDLVWSRANKGLIESPVTAHGRSNLLHLRLAEGDPGGSTYRTEIEPVNTSIINNRWYPPDITFHYEWEVYFEDWTPMTSLRFNEVVMQLRPDSSTGLNNPALNMDVIEGDIDFQIRGDSDNASPFDRDVRQLTGLVSSDINNRWNKFRVVWRWNGDGTGSIFEFYLDDVQYYAESGEQLGFAGDDGGNNLKIGYYNNPGNWIDGVTERNLYIDGFRVWRE